MYVLGERIRSLREKHDISQKRLAESLGISNVQLSRYETGVRRPDPEMIKSIADYFEVSADYLLGVDNKRKQDETKNVKDFFERKELHWDGVPLTEEQLRPIRDLLEVVVKDRLPRYLEERKKKDTSD